MGRPCWMARRASANCCSRPRIGCLGSASGRRWWSRSKGFCRSVMRVMRAPWRLAISTLRLPYKMAFIGHLHAWAVEAAGVPGKCVTTADNARELAHLYGAAQYRSDTDRDGNMRVKRPARWRSRHSTDEPNPGEVTPGQRQPCREDRKSTRLNSSHVRISYAVFCLKKKKQLNYREPYDSSKQH